MDKISLCPVLDIRRGAPVILAQHSSLVPLRSILIPFTACSLLLLLTPLTAFKAPSGTHSAYSNVPQLGFLNKTDCSFKEEQTALLHVASTNPNDQAKGPNIYFKTCFLNPFPEFCATGIGCTADSLALLPTPAHSLTCCLQVGVGHFSQTLFLPPKSAPIQ